MTKTDKKQYKILTDMDMKIIRQDPESLADYVINTKAKEIKKSALIVTIIFVVISFVFGFIMGNSWTRTSIPNNVVKIHVGDNGEIEEGKYSDIIEDTEEGK